jgi:transposase
MRSAYLFSSTLSRLRSRVWFLPASLQPGQWTRKKQVERAIGYLRQNFWPMRDFTDLPMSIDKSGNGWLRSPSYRAPLQAFASAGTAQHRGVPLSPP